MGLFRKTPKIKNRAVLDHAKHRLLKYVIARDAAGCEVVLGRSGRINVQDRELIISCEGRDVFRCDVEQMEIGELLSRDGVRIMTTDAQGEPQSVVCYFV